MPDRGAVEYLNLLILVRLSRKFDASCTIVKICWSLLRSAEAFSDLLKLFRRGTDGVYLFRESMQAMASLRSGYLAREWIPARSARAFREQIERLGSIPT